SAIREAREKDSRIRRGPLEFRSKDGVRMLDLEVRPLAGPTPKDRYYVVLFEESTAAPAKVKKPQESRPPTPERPELEREIQRLTHALETSREYQQSIIERIETSNEERRSSHEEVLSSNEERQSTNEERETAKEELQSSNEELLTVNDELRSRNLELGQANDDLQNILSSVQIPMVIVDTMLRVRRI